MSVRLDRERRRPSLISQLHSASPGSALRAATDHHHVDRRSYQNTMTTSCEVHGQHLEPIARINSSVKMFTMDENAHQSCLCISQRMKIDQAGGPPIEIDELLGVAWETQNTPWRISSDFIHHTKMTFTKVGERVGHTDHTSVLSAMPSHSQGEARTDIHQTLDSDQRKKKIRADFTNDSNFVYIPTARCMVLCRRHSGLAPTRGNKPFGGQVTNLSK